MPLSVEDFTSDVSEKYGFGLDRNLTAATLRKVAAAIETEGLLPQGAEVHGVSKADCFTLTTLTLTFAERICKTDQP
jgi:hypothetical protein